VVVVVEEDKKKVKKEKKYANVCVWRWGVGGKGI
jgi:hypothetical protein